MDEIVYFTYAIGGIEDLRKGDLDIMESSLSIDELNLASPHQNIIIPKFIGVYQDLEIKLETDEEILYKEDIEREDKLLGSISNLLTKIIVEQKGIEESFSPRLIHIGYDPDIYKNDLVRELLGKGTERLAISPYNKIPNFSEKNTAELSVYLNQIGEMQMAREEGISELIRVASEGCLTLQEQLKSFGLTREEFAFLGILDTLRNPPKKSRLTLDPFIINMMSSILRTDKREN